MSSRGPLQMDEKDRTNSFNNHSNSVPIGDVVLKDLPEAMDDRERWRERVRDICADGAT